MNKRTRLVNLTPHEITIYRGSKIIQIIEPSGQKAFITTSYRKLRTVNGIDVVETEWGEPKGIPPPAPNTFYIVSTVVLQGSDREDLIAPDTGKTAVKANGKIIGITRFQVWAWAPGK